MSKHIESIRRIVDTIRTHALRFFTPKEFRAVLLFFAAGLVVLCIRAGKQIVTHYFPKFADSTEIVAERRNDSLFSLLSRKDFVRDSLNFWMPEDTLRASRGHLYVHAQSRKGMSLPKASISLNASAEDSLMLLPGIGKSMASRIVAYRKERGRFRRLEELMNIQGVGEKTFSRIAPYLRLN